VVRFITLATLGALNIARHPGVLMAALPTYALKFVALNPGTAFIVLGSVFLARTGGEALYADMAASAKNRFGWLVCSSCGRVSR
jgi:KUP system potassium uptake protein